MTEIVGFMIWNSRKYQRNSRIHDRIGMVENMYSIIYDKNSSIQYYIEQEKQEITGIVGKIIRIGGNMTEIQGLS